MCKILMDGVQSPAPCNWIDLIRCGDERIDNFDVVPNGCRYTFYCDGQIESMFKSTSGEHCAVASIMEMKGMFAWHIFKAISITSKFSLVLDKIEINYSSQVPNIADQWILNDKRSDRMEWTIAMALERGDEGYLNI